MKYSGFRRDVKRHVLNFRATSGHNVLYMRSDVSKEILRFRLPSSGRRRLLLKVPIDLTSALNNSVTLQLVIQMEIFESMSEVSQNTPDILAILYNSHSRNRVHLPGLQGRTCRTSCGLVACNYKTMFIE